MKSFSILNLIASRIAQRLSLVLAGNIVTAGLGFLSVLIISRNLSVGNFGLFNIVLSTILTTAYLSEFGIDAWVTKTVSRHLAIQEKTTASQILRSTFILRSILGVAVAFIVFTSAEIISIKLFGCPDLASLLKLGSIGVAIASISNYIKNILYTYHLFVENATIQIAMDLVKLFTLIALLSYRLLNVRTAIITFILVPLAGIVLGLARLRQDLFARGKPVENLFGRLFSFSKWIFICNLSLEVSSYIDIFLITTMLGIDSTGIYVLAFNLTYIFRIFMTSLRSVLFPEISRFKDIKQFERYTKNGLMVTVFIIIAAVSSLFLSRIIIPILFGPRYAPSIPVFNLLLLSYVFYPINSVTQAMLNTLNKPHVVTIVTLLRLSLMTLCSYLLIPVIGVIAPALCSLIGNLIVSVIFFVSVFKIVRKGNAVFQGETVVEPYVI